MADLITLESSNSTSQISKEVIFDPLLEKQKASSHINQVITFNNVASCETDEAFTSSYVLLGWASEAAFDVNFAAAGRALRRRQRRQEAP